MRCCHVNFEVSLFWRAGNFGISLTADLSPDSYMLGLSCPKGSEERCPLLLSMRNEEDDHRPLVQILPRAICHTFTYSNLVAVNGSYLQLEMTANEQARHELMFRGDLFEL